MTSQQAERQRLFSLDQILGDQGVIASSLPDYESRPAQVAMARAVAQTLADGGQFVVEAATGTGKTLAYLIPAILSGQRVIISTGTLNLQDQILAKEIPFLRQHVFPDLTALCVKGRQNYLCRYRWNQLLATCQLSLNQEDNELLLGLSRWAGTTETGDRAEIPWLADDAPLWHEICSSGVRCLGAECPENANCFITRLRRVCGGAQILIVNHHLFFADFALRQEGYGEILPRYESVIFDEAHHLEDVVTSHFGLNYSNYQVIDLAKDLEKAAALGPKGKDQEKTIQLARALARQAGHFAALFPQEKGRGALHDFLDQCDAWEEGLDETLAGLDALGQHLETLLPRGELWASLLRRSHELGEKLVTLFRQRDGNFVYWYERREKTFIVSAAPIAVNDILAKLYSAAKSIVFTSATLTTGGEFTYFSERMGLEAETDCLILDSVYDYAAKTLLYFPDKPFPPPNGPGYSDAVFTCIEQIATAARGRTLVLFTSVTAMRGCHAYLTAMTFPYLVLVQGQAPKRVLLDRFRDNLHSVLLAVASFWEGVDIPGESLSCVVIDKLPFEVPSDPVIMARMRKIEENGGNPFVDFQVPRAILALRQGVGRLLRAATDRGVMAVLDVRLFTKPYGRLFRKSLPPSPITRAIDDIESFLR